MKITNHYVMRALINAQQHVDVIESYKGEEMNDNKRTSLTVHLHSAIAIYQTLLDVKLITEEDYEELRNNVYDKFFESQKEDLETLTQTIDRAIKERKKK